MKVIVSAGGRFHAFHLAEQLEKRGYLYKFITTRFNPQYDRISPSKVKTQVFPEIIDRFHWRFRSILNPYHVYLVKDTTFDLLTANYLSNYCRNYDIFVGFASFSLYSMRKAKKAGCLTVLERGSSHISFQVELLKEEYSKFGVDFRMPRRLVERQLEEYEESDYICIPSDFVYKSFVAKGVSPEKLLKIPYGGNLRFLKETPKEDNVFRIIFVGIISLQKGIPYLLQAFQNLRLKNSELLLIGPISRETKPILRRYGGYFKYLGSLSQEELYKYYSNSSIFILPSIQEGFGMVIGEAMSCGLPVITTTNTGGNEIIRNGIDGFIIPIRSIDALKEKILFFYENEEARIAMGRSGAEYIKNFTWDRYGENIVENYERLLEREI